MHVLTDSEFEGICTVGDARYTTMPENALSYLKYLTIGEDPTSTVKLLVVTLETCNHWSYVGSVVLGYVFVAPLESIAQVKDNES